MVMLLSTLLKKIMASMLCPIVMPLPQMINWWTSLLKITTPIPLRNNTFSPYLLNVDATVNAAILLSLMPSVRMVLTNGSYLKDVDVTVAAAIIKQVPWRINPTFSLTKTEQKPHQERLLRNILDLVVKNLKSTWEWISMISGNNMMLLATIKSKSNKWQASWRSYSMSLPF